MDRKNPSASSRVGMLSIDVDTLHDLFPGQTGETDPIYDRALPRVSDLLAEKNIPITFFVVGQDLSNKPENRAKIRKFHEAGHEIANHTFSHVQGFSHLPRHEKKREIVEAHSIIADTIGEAPIGFRAPGWNIDEEALDILEELEYLYDSSVVPTWMSVLFKLVYRFQTGSSKDAHNRTTMGRTSFSLAPATPYRPGTPLWRRGSRRLLEIPLSTVPIIRTPFFGTWSFFIGNQAHKACFDSICRSGRPLNYALHGVEFADAEMDKMKPLLRGIQKDYIPKTLLLPWKRKLTFFNSTLDAFNHCYQMMTLGAFARAANLSRTATEVYPENWTVA